MPVDPWPRNIAHQSLEIKDPRTSVFKDTPILLKFGNSSRNTILRTQNENNRMFAEVSAILCLPADKNHSQRINDHDQKLQRYAPDKGTQRMFTL
ncbi:hypothetical protein QR680_005032 [Steinernema hermaphroditum]|uniref:Uncharacterized protein n=1 Tax=Steinernema hermaphroditum TaxID=289476 RepID=A0AA39HSU2_9BILA|nr:hypothetical protein QR680_005032 [Steinernema hermaphroditum]